MKKLLAGALALIMAFSMTACAKSDAEPQNETKGKEQSPLIDDSLVTMYLLKSETMYDADGAILKKMS